VFPGDVQPTFETRATVTVLTDTTFVCVAGVVVLAVVARYPLLQHGFASVVVGAGVWLLWDLHPSLTLTWAALALLSYLQRTNVRGHVCVWRL
jgi:hypothetical protein